MSCRSARVSSSECDVLGARPSTTRSWTVERPTKAGRFDVAESVWGAIAGSLPSNGSKRFLCRLLNETGRGSPSSGRKFCPVYGRQRRIFRSTMPYSNPSLPKSRSSSGSKGTRWPPKILGQRSFVDFAPSTESPMCALQVCTKISPTRQSLLEWWTFWPPNPRRRRGVDSRNPLARSRSPTTETRKNDKRANFPQFVHKVVALAVHKFCFVLLTS